MVRGKTERVLLKPTVPVLCASQATCSLKLHLTVPQHYERAGCNAQDGDLPISTFCGLRIGGHQPQDDWNTYLTTSYPFDVYGRVTYEVATQSSYTFDMVLRSHGNFALHPVWNNFVVTTKVIHITFYLNCLYGEHNETIVWILIPNHYIHQKKVPI